MWVEVQSAKIVIIDSQDGADDDLDRWHLDDAYINDYYLSYSFVKCLTLKNYSVFIFVFVTEVFSNPKKP